MGNWLELPPELVGNILHRLGAVDILEIAQKVCIAWRKICKDPAMWRVIDMRNSGEFDNMTIDLEKMCRHAVDRSEGQLIDLNIEYFGTDALLSYIVERSRQLKRLKISCCYGCVYEGLNAAVKKLPLLEEIHLNHTYISKEAIADVGRFCPHLKSFKFNIKWCVDSKLDEVVAVAENMPQLLHFQHIGNQLKDLDEFEFNEEALAIAENMPQLRHLQLIGNQITDKGLKAILDGCTHLESLDLRRCLNLKLEGSLGKRCSEHIKDFKRPNNSIKDCEFIIDEKSNDGYRSEFSLDDDDMLSLDYDYEFDDDDDDYGGGVDDDAD